AEDRIIPCAQDRRRDADGQSFFGFPEAMHAGTETGEGDFWRGTHFSETRHDHLFINFAAVIATVFRALKQQRSHGFLRWSLQLARVSDEALYQRLGFVFVHLEPRCTDPGAFGERTGDRMGDNVFRLELRTGLGLLPRFENIFHDRRQAHERGWSFLAEGFRALIAG